jgi:hypothetical protein
VLDERGLTTEEELAILSEAMDKRAIVGAFLIAWAAALQVGISISCNSCIFVTFSGFYFGGSSSQMAKGEKYRCTKSCKIL